MNLKINIFTIFITAQKFSIFNTQRASEWDYQIELCCMIWLHFDKWMKFHYEFNLKNNFIFSSHSLTHFMIENSLFHLNSTLHTFMLQHQTLLDCTETFVVVISLICFFHFHFHLCSLFGLCSSADVALFHRICDEDNLKIILKVTHSWQIFILKSYIWMGIYFCHFVITKESWEEIKIKFTHELVSKFGRKNFFSHSYSNESLS
jgi:hypothetical protein